MLPLFIIGLYRQFQLLTKQIFLSLPDLRDATKLSIYCGLKKSLYKCWMCVLFNYNLHIRFWHFYIMCPAYQQALPAVKNNTSRWEHAPKSAIWCSTIYLKKTCTKKFGITSYSCYYLTLLILHDTPCLCKYVARSLLWTICLK